MCFGGGGNSSPPPAPAAPPPPPSKMDEGAAGRQAMVDQIRASQTSGFKSTVGPGGLGGVQDTSTAPKVTKTLFGT